VPSSTYTLGTSAMLPFKASPCRRVAVGVQHPTTKEAFKRGLGPNECPLPKVSMGLIVKGTTSLTIDHPNVSFGCFFGAVGMLEFGD